MRKILVPLFCIMTIIVNAQSLTGDARSHWNKASIYIENATTESEWQMAINELEKVIDFAPDYPDAYLKLGDAYSHLSSSDAIRKARYYWEEYQKRNPSSRPEIQDKIDRLDALAQLSSLRNRDKIIELLIGRWRDSKEYSSDFWKDPNDMEFFREGNKLMLRYVGTEYRKVLHTNDGWTSGEIKTDPTSLVCYEVPLQEDSIKISVKSEFQIRHMRNDRLESINRFDIKRVFTISAPPLDGVIKGVSSQYQNGKFFTDPRTIYLYKVN